MNDILHPITVPLTLLTASLLLVSFVIITPQMSPFPWIADSDGDGFTDDIDEFSEDPLEWKDSDGDHVGDNSDVFPFDASEQSDLDGDGVGDNIDILDQGNAAIKISLTDFQFLGYDDSYYRWTIIPDVWFNILIDMDNDSIFDMTFESDIFFDTSHIADFFSIQLDIEDFQQSIIFSIIIYDVWETSGSKVTDSEIIDYVPINGMKVYSHSIRLPFSDSWDYSGIGDGDTPDCSISYQFETITID